MPEYQKNGYEDEDFRNILVEIEGLEEEKVSIRARAAGECGGLAKKVKNAKATAKALGIPLTILTASLRSRRLERQLQAIADGIDEDMIEVWEDAAGQFSMFAAVPDEEPDEAPVAKKAAKRAKKAAQANETAEQEEGEKVLSGAAVH